MPADRLVLRSAGLPPAVVPIGGQVLVVPVGAGVSRSPRCVVMIMLVLTTIATTMHRSPLQDPADVVVRTHLNDALPHDAQGLGLAIGARPAVVLRQPHDAPRDGHPLLVRGRRARIWKQNHPREPADDGAQVGGKVAAAPLRQIGESVEYVAPLSPRCFGREGLFLGWFGRSASTLSTSDDA